MADRNKNSYQTLLYDFIKEVLVVCPQCLRRAVVKADGFSIRDFNHDVKVVCASCGFNKKLTEKPGEGVNISIGAPVDPFFQLPLWIQENVNGNLLWAYNYEHLEFIKNFVEAKLRERNGEELSNKSLGSRLPKWMTSGSNRAAILKAIEKVKTINSV